jgi:hypothetical protein
MGRMSDWEPELGSASEQQQAMMENALPAAWEAFRECRDEFSPHECCIVFVVDCLDEIGDRITRGWMGDDLVDQILAIQEESLDQDEPTAPVFTIGFDWEEGQRQTLDMFPYLEPALTAIAAQGLPRGDAFVAIAVTAGGASLFTVPTDTQEFCEPPDDAEKEDLDA